MKHLHLLLMTLLMGVSTCTSQNSDQFRIGEAKNGTFTITENLDKVKAHWTSVMKTQNNTQQISEMAIVSAMDSKTSETYYIITGKNAQGTFTIANEVSLIDGAFYFRNSTVSGTVSCSGCNYGCNPEKLGGKWFCDSDCGGNCNKTVTVAY